MIRYRLLTWILALPLLLYTAWLSFKHRDLTYLLQRFGWNLPSAGGPSIWLHAASVGEVRALLPLVRHINHHNRALSIVFTTCTPTGKSIIEQQLGGMVRSYYFPLDYRLAARRLVKTINPQLCIFMETELWPNVYAVCHALAVPLVIVNGRLTARTLGANRWMLSLYAQALEKVTLLLARSEADAQRFIQLGAPEGIVRVLGNLKFAVDVPDKTAAPKNLQGRPYVLLASSHEDEESSMLRLWASLVVGNRLLVIAPRHPNRIKDIVTKLSKITSKIQLHSAGGQVKKETLVYLIDSVGHLMEFFSDAQLVIMGGSFVPVGGHNILEPAALGKPIVFGPHMANFSEECETFLQANAAVQIDGFAGLSDLLRRFFNDPGEFEMIAKNALALATGNNQIVDRYYDALKDFWRS